MPFTLSLSHCPSKRNIYVLLFTVIQHPVSPSNLCLLYLLSSLSRLGFYPAVSFFSLRCPQSTAYFFSDACQSFSHFPLFQDLKLTCHHNDIAPPCPPHSLSHYPHRREKRLSHSSTLCNPSLSFSFPFSCRSFHCFYSIFFLILILFLPNICVKVSLPFAKCNSMCLFLFSILFQVMFVTACGLEMAI